MGKRAAQLLLASSLSIVSLGSATSVASASSTEPIGGGGGVAVAQGS